MTDKSDNEYHIAEASGSSNSIIDAIEGGLTSIPAPVRKNVFKALSRLIYAAADVPVAYLEGVAAERRAETFARTRLISTSADQIAKQMNVEPSVVIAANRKFSQKVVREHINLDQIAKMAISDLETAQPAPATSDTSTVDEISPDWLNAFEREAVQMSTERMQLLFARLLAGEIRKPSSFSIRTVKLMAQLDNRVAKSFQKLCSICISLQIPGDKTIIDARAVSLGTSAASSSLQAYGLSFDELNVLHEYGLIVAEYNSRMDYGISIATGNGVPLSFKYQGSAWGLTEIQPNPATGGMKSLQLEGVLLSHSGRELLQIVETEPDESYTTALREYLEKIGYVMVPVRAG